MFEKKKKNKEEEQSPQVQKAHMTTKAHKFTLSIVLASHRIKGSRSLNEFRRRSLLGHGLHVTLSSRIA
jgi:hypothetical protein